MIPFPGTFYWRNKMRSIPLFILVSLSVAMIGVVATLTGSILDSIYSVDVRPFEYFSLLVSKDLTIEASTMESLERNATIERVIPFLDSSIRANGLFGSEPRRIYALVDSDINYVLDSLGLELIRGSLPRSGSAEIVLHESIMKSRGLAIGSVVGQEVDNTDYLWGLFEISGILSGPIPIGIASLDYFKQHWVFDLGADSYALMAFAKNDVQSMNETLEERYAERLYIRDFAYAFESYQDESREMDLLLWILNISIISIISLSMGMLNTIHFLTRMKEYGILSLIGLSLGTLLRRTLMEVSILSFSGFVGGTALSWLLTWVVSTSVFAPRGIPVGTYSLRYVVFTLPIPIFLAIFSFLTIRWNISKMDVIKIIEGRDL